MEPRIIHLQLLVFVLMLSGLPQAWSQTANEPTANSPIAQILVARSTYFQGETANEPSNGQRLPEFAPVRTRPPFPPSVQYPYPRGRVYGGMRCQRANWRGALIGALVGFGIGAAIGAKANKDPHASASAPVLFGSFGALIGAGIGVSHP